MEHNAKEIPGFSVRKYSSKYNWVLYDHEYPPENQQKN